MTETEQQSTIVTTTSQIDLDRFVSYDDGEATIICDRQADATAWIRSSQTVDVSR